MKKNLLLLLLATSLFSCKQNPYPAVGNLNVEQRQEQRKVEPPLAISVDDLIDYQEGRYREYPIRVSVKDPGTPIVSIDNLPAGAEFDAKTFILKWRPSFFDGNDPVDPTIKSRIYPITIWLRNSADPIRALRRTINLVVNDSPQGIDVVPNRVTSVDEGQKFSNTFTIANADFPKGPYRIITTGMPPNTDLIKVDENTYKLEFTPDYYHVNRRTEGSSKVYKGKIIVANPANQMVTKDLDITVNDKRLEAKLVTPPNLTQGLDVSFQVVGYDLNKEMAPVVTMSSAKPAFGKFVFSEIKNEESNSTVLNISWTDIPPVHNGEEFTLTFKSCVLGNWSSIDNCKESKTIVKILVHDRKSPTIARTDWPAGEMIYLSFAETVTKKIVVKDAEDPTLKPKVEIFPEEIRKYVTWNGDKLSMNFTEPGVFQFNVKATSDYSVSSAESFLIEVFPKDRNKTLFFADSTRDPEVIFYKTTFKNVDIMNPAIQDINVRNLSGRETLVIGTSSLMDVDVQPMILKAIDKIKNIVVASPLIDQLPDKFLAKLRNDYGLITIGRYSQLPNLPPLETMQFAKTSQFANPLNPIFLKRISSSESHDPMLFNGGLYEPNKICKGVLGLSLDGTNPYVIGVVCNRENGGRISLLGTEWADLKVGAGDEQIPVQWFNTMIKDKFFR
ncbi:MAG: hypothetical protein H7281_06140 [Bacteriovorax sp.]|nr:hypothetical protein [Bacteriovorax sp.]